MARRGLSIGARLTLGALVPGLGLGLLGAYLASAAIERAAAVADTPALVAAVQEQLVTRLAGVAVLCAVLGAGLAWWQARGLLRRMHAVTAASEAFVAGKDGVRIRDGRGDELGVLADSVDFMTDHLATVVGRARERAKRAAEADVAQAIQGAIVPAAAELERSGFAVAGELRPSAQGGGDFWSYYPLDEDRTMVVVGGATGHGLEPILVAAAAKSACDAARTARGAAITPADVLEAMNAAVFQQARRRQVMTCFASIVDVRRRAVHHANAGHRFPYLYRGRGEAGEFRPLTSRGNRLGEVREARYEASETDLEPGDLLVWYTDGVLGCENASGEPLGDRRLRAAVRLAAPAAPPAVRDRVLGECLTFCGAIPPKDDLTLVVGRVT